MMVSQFSTQVSEFRQKLALASDEQYRLCIEERDKLLGRATELELRICMSARVMGRYAEYERRSDEPTSEDNTELWKRIHLPGMLESRIRDKGIDPASPGIKEYLDVFKSAGVPPHGGGGIGLDRVVAWYLALPTVHHCAYCPRTPKRLLP
ncbi:hypothetical protein B0T24DRAFT_598447 [Lasiosphaeria ovina]|uniref:Aminoacyl-tRNA synthetase class II (D/K/N) domain-containing protein n=1 Tax=Lasiosphaeria ovina TaxID=92902 RepID=A0AAE0N0P2_9PEZI|nr:hypothetical protein B0T24DRAFT_598447 [Lasiosphaeria ovina]